MIGCSRCAPFPGVGLIPGPTVFKHGRTHDTLAFCICRTVAIAPAPTPSLDGPSRAAGEKEDS